MERSHRPIALLAALLGFVALGLWMSGRAEERPVLPGSASPTEAARGSESSSTIEVPFADRADEETRQSLALSHVEEFPTGGPSVNRRGIPEPIPGARVRLRLIDAQTRALIAGLGFEVYRERGGDRVLASGTSDENGYADIEDVEPNVVLFRTEYKPPYARTFEALWLDPGDERELTIEVVRGGRITGRLVDPYGRPVAGLQIVRGGKREGLPLSDENGRFELEGVTPTPKGIWVKADGMAPERYSDMHFTVLDPPYTVGSFGANPKPGETEDVGDIQVERRVGYRGRVVDEEGEPQSGVLVGMRAERAGILRMGAKTENEFQFYEGKNGRLAIHAGEGLTDSSGHFEFSGVRSSWGPYAIAATGEVVWWRFPKETLQKVLPTEVELPDIVISTTPLYWFEFRGEDGRRASIKRRIKDAARPTGSVHSSLGFGDVTVQFYDEDGAAVGSKITQSPDLLARVAFAGDPTKVTALRIFFPGYLPIFEKLDDVGVAALRPGELRSYKLTPKLAIRGKLNLWDDRPGTGYVPATFALSCEISPTPAERSYEGSGLGSVIYRDLAQGTIEFELPVLSNEPFWIHARSGRCLLEPSVFGPFLPGDTVHELELSFAADETDSPEPFLKAHDRPESIEVPLQVFEFDGEPAAERTSVQCGPNWGRVEEDGRGDVRLFNSETGPVAIRRRLDSGETAMQTIDSWQVDPVDGVEVHMEEWQTVEIVVRGLHASRRAVAMSPQLLPTESSIPEKHARGALGVRLPDLQDGAARWRFVLGEGGWQFREGSLVTSGLTGSIDVLDEDELQVFDFWME